jgi:hypothetical protein
VTSQEDELFKSWTASMEKRQEAELAAKLAIERAIEAKISELMAEFDFSCAKEGTRSPKAVKDVLAQIQLLRHNQHFSSQFVKHSSRYK